MPQTRLNSPDWSKRDRGQSNRTQSRPDHQAHWYRDRNRSIRRRESLPARASGKKLIRRRSRTGYLINFYCLFSGGCNLIYSPWQPRDPVLGYHHTGHMPRTAHAETATCGLTSFSDVTDVTLTSSQLGIVTLPLITESGYGNSKLKFKIMK